MIDGGRMEFNQGRMAGSALGVTMGGVYDRQARTVDLKGTLAPAYAVNSVLGGLPVVGDLFVSREGEGLLALTYNITGPLEEARVFVNPLSALAPGFLRRLFQFGSRTKNKPLAMDNSPGSLESTAAPKTPLQPAPDTQSDMDPTPPETIAPAPKPVRDE